MRTAIILAAVLASTACVSVRDRHGYVIERGEDELEALAGIDTKESVLARYGEPSMRPAVADDVWYYVTSATNTRAFYKTETTNRRVVAFHFDDQGTVQEVSQLEMEDGIPVRVSDRVTRTRGKELSILEQLVGAVGQVPGAVDPDDAQ